LHHLATTTKTTNNNNNDNNNMEKNKSQNDTLVALKEELALVRAQLKAAEEKLSKVNKEISLKKTSQPSQSTITTPKITTTTASTTTTALSL